MHVNCSVVHTYPTVDLPSYEAISHPQIREAIEHLINTDEQVRKGQEVDRRLKVGHSVDELTPQEIADAVTAAREAGAMRAKVQGQFHEAISKHHAEWREQVTKQAGKDRSAILKDAKSLLAKVSEFEINAGLAEMVNRGTTLEWKYPAEADSINGVQNALNALIAKLDG